MVLLDWHDSKVAAAISIISNLDFIMIDMISFFNYLINDVY